MGKLMGGIQSLDAQFRARRAFVLSSTHLTNPLAGYLSKLSAIPDTCHPARSEASALS
jgi:hypothetical protein